MLANLIYLTALVLASPWVAYRMLRHGRYRRGLRQKFWGLSATDVRRLRLTDSRCVWLHAVSVGEVNVLGVLIQRWRRRDPDRRFVISTSTDTGYDLAVTKFGHSAVFFCPLDFTWAVKRTFRSLRPEALILAELELWPNLLAAARSARCPVAVVNGRLSARSAARYQALGRLMRPTFSRLTWVGCQDAPTAQRFAACGASHTHVTGSLKFDGAPTERDDLNVQRSADWMGVSAWHRVWCVGSTQAGEEGLALRVYRRLQKRYPELRLMLVPRHRERFAAVADSIRAAGYDVRRRSTDEATDSWDDGTVVLVDTIGELRQFWGTAAIATVGGSFGNRGGQNMLEPAGYGCAVSFGPNTKNFADIAERLLTEHAAVRVADEQELEAFVERCLSDIPAADSLGLAARAFVIRQQGATERTLEGIGSMLGQETEVSFESRPAA